MTSAAITGYGGVKEVLIAVAVLAVSQALFWLRRLQDRTAAQAAAAHKAH